MNDPRRSAYALLGTAIFVVLLLLFAFSIADLLLLSFIAILFAVYLTATTDWLERRFRMPRRAGIALALVVTAIALAGLGVLIVPPVVDQSQELVRALPRQLAQWEQNVLTWIEQNPTLARLLGPVSAGQSYFDRVFQQVSTYFAGVVPYVFSGIRATIHVVSVLIIGIYLAIRPTLYRDGVLALTPPQYRPLAREILRDLGRALRAWLGGQAMAMTVLGVLTWIGLELLGVPFALAFGVFAGLAAIVPFFGTIVSTLLPALFVLSSGGLWLGLLVIAWGVVVHLVEANFVAPMIMQHRVELPPVLTILSVLVMGKLLGLVGLLVAVPVLATALVLMRRIYVEQILEGRAARRRRENESPVLDLSEEAALADPAVTPGSAPDA
ncbi:MAG: AI-2E family transporter [Gemmatimonadota bacterium]